MSSSSSTASLGFASSLASSSSENTGSGKARAATSCASTVPKNIHYHHPQQQQASTSRSSGGQCNTCYQTFADKASLHKHWKSHAHAFLPASSSSSTTTWKIRDECTGSPQCCTTNIAGDRSECANRKDDDVDESRLIIDLDSTAPTTSSEPSLTSALSSSSSTLSPALTLRQQAVVAAAENVHSRTATAIMTTANTHLLSTNVQPQQQPPQHEGDIPTGNFAGTTSVSGVLAPASSLVGLAQQIQLQHQQQNLTGGTISNMNARIPTPRLPAPGVPVPVMMPSQTPSAANSYLLSAALSPYAAAQQLLLARAAAAAVGGGGANGTPNPAAAAAAQLFLPNAAQTASALPYSYLMAAGFSPFCLPLNDASLAAAAAAAASGAQNPAAMAAAIANAGLLVPQTALASAAAAQLLCQQASAGAGIRIQGSTATPPAGCNENMGIQKTNYDALRRVSAPDIKHLQRQHVTDGEVLVQQGNNHSGNLPSASVGNNNAIVSTASLTPAMVASLSREAVSEHIKRLISENEAIVEPPPALLKRRSYTKCHQGSASLDISLMGGMAPNCVGPGTRPPLGRSNRSQSLIDPPSMVAAASLHPGKQQQTAFTNVSHYQILKSEEMSSPSSSLSPTAVDSSVKLNSCQFCNISFRNSTSLRAHEFRCAHRVENFLENQEAVHKNLVSSPTAGIVTPNPEPVVIPLPVTSFRGNTCTPNPEPVVVPSPVASLRGNTCTPIGRNAVSNQGTIAQSNPTATCSREGGGENKHPLKKRILALAEIDAQKFGSASTSSVSVQSPPEAGKSIAVVSKSGFATPLSVGDIARSAVTSTTALHTASDLSMPKNVHAGVVSTERRGSVGAVPSAAERYLSINAGGESAIFVVEEQSPTTTRLSDIQKAQMLVHRQISSSTSAAAITPHGISQLSLLPKINLSPAEQAGRFHPYRLTFKVHQDSTSTTTAGFLSTSPRRSAERVKPQQLTQTTFCCQRKSLITFSSFVPLDSKDSAYAIWPQVSVSPSDAKLNVMMMGGCNVRARWSVVKYSTATTNMSAMLITDSSYWEHSKRLQRLATAAVVASTGGGGQQTIHEQQSTKEADACAVKETTSEEAVEIVKQERTSNDDEQPMETNVASSAEQSKGQKTPVSAAKVTTTTLSRQRLKDILTSSGSIGNNGQTKKVVVCNGGYKTNEAYTYVRGRGRGRYVCERCGIRCKKPSMLKKHIRTHLNVRPYTCFQCMFSFKTKGNLTKHMKSQAHTKKLASLTTSNGNNSFILAENKASNIERLNRLDNDSEYDTEEHEDVDGYSTEEDGDENSRCFLRNGEYSTAELRRRRYSYKNIWTNVKDGCYPQRDIRTPPPSPTNANQVCVDFSLLFDRCDTAPPALNTEPASVRSADEQEENSLSRDGNNGMVNVTVENAIRDKNGEDEGKLQTLNPASVASTSSDDKHLSPLLPNTSSSSSSLEPYFLNEGKCQCEICGKTFPKIGLLRLHMNVHYFEQTGRRYEHRCGFCNSSFRSRSLLQKHTSTAHQKQLQQQQPGSAEKNISGENQPMECSIVTDCPRRSISNEDQSESTLGISTVSQSTSTAPGSAEKSQLSPTPSSGSSNNPRPFECGDCKIAFRIHGHLSKHLRSKLHITKLENMGKLPIGLFARLEDAGAQYIAEIDTSDCANSLRSLLKLAEQFNMLTAGEDGEPGCNKHQQQTKIDEPAPLSDVPTTVSLACTEEMLPNSPAPPPQVSIAVEHSSADLNTTAVKSQQQEQITKIGSETKSINGYNTKPVILAADVWIPPRAEALVKEVEKPTTSSSNVGPALCKNDGACYERCCTDVTQKVDSGKSTKSPITVTSPSVADLPSLCRICNLNFQSPLELEIHLHADHVVMRDGNDFRCPRANCDSVYPNRESLRHHLALHFYGRLDESHPSTNCGGGNGSETPNGCDVSKATVAALSRKLGGNGNCSQSTSADGSDSAHHQAEKTRKRTMKTQLVKLSSIPESGVNQSNIDQTAAAAGSFSSNSNSSSSRGPAGAGGIGSTDASPISACGAGLDSDASRASINSCHSTSPLAAADSPAAYDSGAMGGRSSSGRQSVKRKSLDDCGQSAAKRIANATSTFDHQQLLQMQALQQQSIAFSSTPPNLNGFYQRLPTSTSMQTQSPVMFHQPNNIGNGATSIGGWSASPLLQQVPGARQQISPPQPFYFSASPHGGAPISTFYNLQNQFASAAMAQHNAAKLLAAGGVNSLWNSPTAAMASQLLNSSVATSDAVAAFSAAAGLTGLNDAATAAAIGLLLPQSCILCGKQYPNNALLQEHLLTHALSARPYVCEHCDAGFTTEQALQSHRPCRQQRIDV